MANETNVSGISENLADSIAQEHTDSKINPVLPLLWNKKIAIAVSDNEDLEQFGFSKQHITDISVELARYLIVNGATVLYGGDLRDKGITSLFAELSNQYKFLDDQQVKFINYFAFPNGYTLTLEDRDLLNYKEVELRELPAPAHLGFLDTAKKYDIKTNKQDRYLFAECFTDMRRQMTKDCFARIAVGGKKKNFAGYYPGIIEEVRFAFEEGKPVYILGGYGGAAKLIAQLLNGESASELTNDYQFDTDFLKEFRAHAAEKDVTLDYNEMVTFFHHYTIQGLSDKNGLTIEENMILFESTNIHELVFLIIKGLKKILQ